MQMSKTTPVIKISKSENIDRIFALLFVLLPIIQPLKTPFSITWSTAILIVSVPYISYKLFTNKITVRGILPITVYALYRIVNHGTDGPELLTLLFLIALSIVLQSGLIRVDAFYHFTVVISQLASYLIILQTLTHYLLGIHLKLLPWSWLRTDGMQASYREQLSTGISAGLYRPSAFFIEPAVFALFAFLALFSLLVASNEKSHSMRQGIIISIGILMSTSGLGILLTVLCWAYLLWTKIFHGRSIYAKWLLISLGAVVAFVVAIFTIPFLRSAVMRIFTGINGQNSAITGRLGSGQYYYSLLTTHERIWGTGKNPDEFSMFLSGMYSLIMSDGIVGYILFELMFLLQAIRMRNRFSWVAIAVAFLSIFSNVATIQSTVMFLIAVMAGNTLEKDRTGFKRF